MAKSRRLDVPQKPTVAEMVTLLEEADGSATFRLLDLPAEIREMIFIKHHESLRTLPQAVCQPPLSRVSQQLRREALPLFYSHCTFDFITHDVWTEHEHRDAIIGCLPTEPLADTDASNIARITRFWASLSGRAWVVDLDDKETPAAHLLQYGVPA